MLIDKHLPWLLMLLLSFSIAACSTGGGDDDPDGDIDSETQTETPTPECLKGQTGCNDTWRTICQDGQFVAIENCATEGMICRDGYCIEPDSSDGDDDSFDLEDDTAEIELADGDSESDSLVDGDLDVEEAPEIEEEADFIIDGDAEPDLPVPDCQPGPCCDNGQWVETGQPCVSGADELDCTLDSCNEFHLCDHILDDDACLIQDACYDSQAPHPTNSCLYCNPAIGQTTWTFVTDGQDCDDLNSETQNDQCNNGQCLGEGCTCSGVDLCCDGCQPQNENAACEDTFYCTIGTTCQSGVCTGGSERDCSSVVTNPTCQQAACNNALSRCEARPANQQGECNDDLACTHTDICLDGACYGTPYTCNDNSSCTIDTCNSDGSCDYDDIPNDCGERECGPSTSGCYSCGICGDQQECNELGECIDLPDGDSTDGDTPDGDASDGDVADGDMIDGDAPDGDMELSFATYRIHYYSGWTQPYLYHSMDGDTGSPSIWTAFPGVTMQSESTSLWWMVDVEIPEPYSLVFLFNDGNGTSVEDSNVDWHHPYECPTCNFETESLEVWIKDGLMTDYPPVEPDGDLDVVEIEPEPTGSDYRVHLYSGWTEAYLYHSYDGNTSQDPWTPFPGVSMTFENRDQWWVTDVHLEDEAALVFVFNNGDGVNAADPNVQWHQPYGCSSCNFSTTAAEVWVKDGILTETVAPEGY